MLLHHTALYFLARGLPGLINFLALSVYTRLLAPGEYGRYALALATVSLAYTVLFQWMNSGLLRFLPRHAGREAQLQSTILAVYLFLVAASGIVGGVIYVFAANQPWRDLLPVAICLLWIQAWLELNLQLLSSRFKPLRYGALSASRAILALTLGSILIWLGWSVAGPLWGLVLSGLVAAFWFGRAEWGGVRLRKPDSALVRELLGYGLPLSITFIFGFIISTSDRYLIAWLIDENATGLYAAGYDLAQFSLGMLMMIVNLAAYPILVRALEHEGVEAARGHLERQGLLLLAIAAPATAGFILLAGNIAGVLLGLEYRSTAEAILPWIAAAAFVGGLKAFYFDLAFQLGRHTTGQVWVVLIAGLLNVALNLLWIPVHGLLGAAWATLAAYTVALVLSIWLGNRYFRMPLVPKFSFRILAATGVMALALWPFHEFRSGVALLAQVTLGGMVYGAALLAFNAGNCRVAVMAWLRQLRAYGA